MLDRLQRPLRDLRISVTDRCNFRCRYCMPAEVFGAGYQYLPRAEILTFEEIGEVAKAAIAHGVEKIRLTGGEPLLRRDLAKLVAKLSRLDGLQDLALTTNGALLRAFAEPLQEAGLHRVTVSLDAIEDAIFRKMNGDRARIASVLDGVAAAQDAGLPVKVNAVIQRGVNESQILPLLEWARTNAVTLRFIEYMDVGESHRWRQAEVVSGEEILAMVAERFPLQERPREVPGEVAESYQFLDERGGEFGVITSVSRPFCGNCSRLRLSANGHLHTCLFSSQGSDLRPALREGVSDVSSVLSRVWRKRSDRYSEERGKVSAPKVEMSYLGG